MLNLVRDELDRLDAVFLGRKTLNAAEYADRNQSSDGNNAQTEGRQSRILVSDSVASNRTRDNGNSDSDGVGS